MTAKTLRDMPKGLPHKEVQDIIKRSVGRPAIYDKALAEEIIEYVAAGGSVSQVCRENDHLPAPSTFHKWVLKDEGGIGARYRVARAVQARGMADDLLAIADDESKDFDGEGRPNHAKVQRDKLRLHARQWILGRVLPKEFGDKTQVEHITGEQKQLDLDRLTVEERGQLAALIAKATPSAEPVVQQVENHASEPVISGPLEGKQPNPVLVEKGVKRSEGG